MFEINGILTTEIEKNKARDRSIIMKIERLLTDVYKKLSVEVNTKIANELSACLFEVNFTFTAKLIRNNNELNKKLTREIENFKTYDTGYVIEIQKIFVRLFNIEEARQNDFDRITSLKKSVITSINDFYKKINQYYVEIQSRDFN